MSLSSQFSSIFQIKNRADYSYLRSYKRRRSSSLPPARFISSIPSQRQRLARRRSWPSGFGTGTYFSPLYSFTMLPTEIMLHIISFLSVTDTRNLLATCRTLYQYMNIKEIWDRIFQPDGLRVVPYGPGRETSHNNMEIYYFYLDILKPRYRLVPPNKVKPSCTEYEINWNEGGDLIAITYDQLGTRAVVLWENKNGRINRITEYHLSDAILLENVFIDSHIHEATDQLPKSVCHNTVAISPSGEFIAMQYLLRHMEGSYMPEEDPNYPYYNVLVIYRLIEKSPELFLVIRLHGNFINDYENHQKLYGFQWIEDSEGRQLLLFNTYFDYLTDNSLFTICPEEIAIDEPCYSIHINDIHQYYWARNDEIELNNTLRLKSFNDQYMIYGITLGSNYKDVILFLDQVYSSRRKFPTRKEYVNLDTSYRLVADGGAGSVIIMTCAPNELGTATQKPFPIEEMWRVAFRSETVCHDDQCSCMVDVPCRGYCIKNQSSGSEYMTVYDVKNELAYSIQKDSIVQERQQREQSLESKGAQVIINEAMRRPQGYDLMKEVLHTQQLDEVVTAPEMMELMQTRVWQEGMQKVASWRQTQQGQETMEAMMRMRGSNEALQDQLELFTQTEAGQTVLSNIAQKLPQAQLLEKAAQLEKLMPDRKDEIAQELQQSERLKQMVQKPEVQELVDRLEGCETMEEIMQVPGWETLALELVQTKSWQKMATEMLGLPTTQETIQQLFWQKETQEGLMPLLSTPSWPEVMQGFLQTGLNRQEVAQAAEQSRNIWEFLLPDMVPKLMQTKQGQELKDSEQGKQLKEIVEQAKSYQDLRSGIIQETAPQRAGGREIERKVPQESDLDQMRKQRIDELSEQFWKQHSDPQDISDSIQEATLKRRLQKGDFKNAIEIKLDEKHIGEERKIAMINDYTWIVHYDYNHIYFHSTKNRRLEPQKPTA